LIIDLFDTITTTNCRTHEDIANSSALIKSAQEACEVLTLIRTPEIADEYGWTVPHVPRGRPAPGDVYRYMAVGLNGEVLTPSDIQLVRRGALSTMTTIFSQTRNEANALRLTIPMVADAAYKKRARDMAKVLDGISVQADLEAQRLEALLAS
jgi:hypothetical protein